MVSAGVTFSSRLKTRQVRSKCIAFRDGRKHPPGRGVHLGRRIVDKDASGIGVQVGIFCRSGLSHAAARCPRSRPR